MDTNILVINCGSSSLKYRLIRMPDEKELAGGEAVRVGVTGKEPSAIKHFSAAGKRTVAAQMPNHSEAFRAVISLLKQDAENGSAPQIDCFAHRYVHPGAYFTKTALLDRAALTKLKKTVSLAPVHNGISLGLIAMCQKEFKNIPQYAVFDTAFHKTIPKELSSYAIDAATVKKYSLKKIGFHGISHRYIMEEACRFLGKEPSTQKIISCHLGSGGSSVCAIKHGMSINNSMGFTPLEGLMMNTRCGDLDIGVLFNVMASNGLTPEQAENLLNFKSGILGVFSASADMRDVAKLSKEDEKAKITFDMYVRRVRKYIGFYSLLLKKADMLVFTDTLGVEMPELRASVCEGLECFGIKLDPKKNEASAYSNTDLTLAGSETKVLVIPTNEEIMIARESYKEFRHDNRS